MTFTVVVFTDENVVAIVPSSWLDGNSCCLRSGSVKLTGDKATDIGGIIAQVIGALEPILIKAVTTMSDEYCGELTILGRLQKPRKS